MKTIKQVILIFFFYQFLLSQCLVLAQENHYWSQQFGARSSLLGGAVVGGVRDNSAIYYNPAAVALIKHQGLTVNANAYKFDAILVKNGAGKDIDVPSNRLSLFPQLISGTKHIKNNERLRWGYTLLTRNQANVRLRARHESTTDVIPRRAGLEEFIGIYQNDIIINEIWAGAGLAYKVSNHVALGFTQFMSYRNQVVSSVAERHALPKTQTTSTAFFEMLGNNSHSILMNNFSLLWKVGLALDFDQLKLGLALTTPSVNLFGFGDVQREISSLNMALFQSNSINRNFLGTAGQKVSKITFKTPFSAALGFEYSFPKTKVMFTSEYFDKIDAYKVIDADPGAFLRPSDLEIRDGIPNADDFLTVSTYARAVMNYALGLEQKLNDKVSILLGFRTDRDSYERSNDINRNNIELGTTFWDLYHFSGGFTLNRKNGILNFGLSYAYSGSNQIRQFVNYADPKDTNALLGLRDNSASVNINSFNLVIGLTYFLEKQAQSTEK